ncbi:MAG TPA: HIT domain-containing protein [Armatimonadota bacterium]|nr:HIT domain-containing protein [Armatimonadota bacterium]
MTEELPTVDRLWAPWRMEYIEQVDRGGECILCAKPREHDDGKTHIVHRGDLAYTILNAYPYSSGHLMIAPYRHTGDLLALSEGELCAITVETRLGTRLLAAAMAPQGFNIGLNLGRAAGAGIADHLHVHVVPRWSGDTNFMPVIGDTRVLPQALDDTYGALRAALARIEAEKA